MSLSAHTIKDILKDSNYSLEQFTDNEIAFLEDRIFLKNDKPHIVCLVRDKDIQIKPEEIIRQLYIAKLINHYGYEKHYIKCEYTITFGREKKSADIVVLDNEHKNSEYIIIEVKKPKLKDGKEQLKSYCNATGTPIAVWTNGNQISYYHRKDPNYFEDISDIPKANQTLEELLNEPFTWRDLVVHDKILTENKSLKNLVIELEDEVLANAGVDVFEELFKLIFAKLFDESLSSLDKKDFERQMKRILPNGIYADFDITKQKAKELDVSDYRQLEFRNKGGKVQDLKVKIQTLFDKAKDKWKGVFSDDTKIELSDSHLAICVSSLHDVKLFNSNLHVIDEAFEYLVNKSSKGEKGQYFTPRHVIDMCVKMLNPQRGESVIDTASGSCGFPVHNIFAFTGQLFQNAEIPKEYKDDVLRVFGIDFDERAVRVSRTLNLIAGDGQTNVLHLNSLDYKRWKETVESRDWLRKYQDGFERLEKYCVTKGQYQKFNFDILMANPPFAGDIKESTILSQYELSKNDKGKAQTKVGRDILFIERNLDFVRPGGRLAIVLPQGRFNNTSDKYIRDYMAERARILAVVGLHGNTFKPHTGTKTSVIFLQKWNDDTSDMNYYCPKMDDYPIFFATSEKAGKDNSGDYIFVKNADGVKNIDKFGHFIIDHDLHNQGGELPDGIAEAFEIWATEQNLSFAKGEVDSSGKKF